jgi:MSHA biogenesis protein MshM
MYIKHFGLVQYPFSLTPNTRFFLKLPGQQEAFNSLIQALENGDTLSEISGEVGTGKTMLCRKVLNTLEFYPERYATAFLPNPLLNEEGIIHALADELDVTIPKEANYRELFKLVSARILELANQNKRIVLFVDEAQAIPDGSLKALYLLTQISAPNGRSLQVVLIGQPELDSLLDQAELTQIREKIQFNYRLPKLDRQDIGAYVEHRLRKAGYSGSRLFNDQALDLVHEASQGTPRLISILCHKAMMVAYGKGEQKVTADFVRAAMADTDSVESKQSWAQRIFSRFEKGSFD